MALVRDVIAHILFHINAESSDSDESQVAGVDRRAQFVRSALQDLIDDDRDISPGQILQEIHNLAPGGRERAAFRRTIRNINIEDISPQLAIQEWVARASESIDG